MNATTGRIPLPSATTITPYKESDDDIALFAHPTEAESEYPDKLKWLKCSDARTITHCEADLVIPDRDIDQATRKANG
jgi:hypothetical protein